MYKLFNDNWQFAFKPLNEIPNDSEYKNVDIPHDWQIHNTHDLYSTGDGYYRKSFSLIDISEKKYTLRFEGVYMDSEIYLNGEKIYEWKYGYTTFDVPLKNVREGENEVVVRVRYQSPNSRWYSGAGIYRKVLLRETGLNCLAADGTYVVSNYNGESWKTEIDTELECSVSGTVRHTLFDAEGNKVVICEKEFSNGDTMVSQSFEIDSPRRWGCDDPYLYTLMTELVVDGNVLDSKTERIGYRYLKYDANEGFYLNGENLKLNGACMHHDLGALGSAVNREATRRQLLILKEMGVNSIRTSHNPPSVELMELCDELGILVDSEIFDMWELKKNDFDYHRFFPEWHERDVRSWVRRDRNHPSIIMWSIGNEIYDTHASYRGVEVTKELSRCIRIDDYKNTTPITIGSNYMRWKGAQDCAEELDIIGYNYIEEKYDEHHAQHPNWVIYGSETASTVQSRGVYHFPASIFTTTYDDHQCSSLLNCATGWGAPSPEYNISVDRDRKFSLGQYIWTGFDYIGEPTPYHTKNSYFGHIDTAGLPKDTFYAYRAEWNKNAEPFVHLFPYWDFNEGQLVDIFAFSNCYRTEVFVNGESMGDFVHDHKNGQSLTGRWQVPYHRGEITAVGYDENGNKVCEHTRKSFSDPAKIVLKPNKTTLLANGEDMLFVEVSVVDKDSNPVENAANRINCEVSGEIRLVGMDNGDSTDYEQYKTNSRKLFSGKLLIMLAAKACDGIASLKVSSPDLPDEVLEIKVLPSEVEEGVSCVQEITTLERKSDVSVRKLEMSVSSQLITPDAPNAVAKVKILPENATYSFKDVRFKAVTDTGIETNLLDIEQTEDGGVLKPRGDGKYRLRAYCKNQSFAEEVISEIEMENTGFGPAAYDPYSDVICASLCTNATEFQSMMEGGIMTYHGAVVKFDCVDLGAIGSDEVSIGIYTYNENVIPVDLLDGEGNVIKTLNFQAKNEWNVYKYNTFKLDEKLKGLKNIAFRFDQDLRFKGFKFAKPRRLGAELLAVENDEIYGDSYEVSGDIISHIGNNVTVSFKEIDLADGANKIEITGKTHNKSDTIHLRFSDSEAQAVEFENSDGIVSKTFDILSVKGIQDLNVVFLPGCDFDLKSIKFIK